MYLLSMNKLLIQFAFLVSNCSVWGFTAFPSRSIPTNLYSSTHDKTQYEIKKEDHILTPPLPLRSLDLGETIAPLDSLPDLTITRLSFDPNVFLLRNFLSTSTEQLSMIMGAVNQGMEYSGTSSGDVVSQRFKSYTSWIYPTEDNTEESKNDVDGDTFEDAGEMAKYMTDLSAFLFFPESLKNGQIPNSVEAEAVQVVRYLVDGKYEMHHDGYSRFLTVLCYLNGVAGTWFPYAIVEEDEYMQVKNSNEPEDVPDMSTNNVAKDKVPGRDGLLVVGSEDFEQEEDWGKNKHVAQVSPGDAIVFYSYDWIETNQEINTASGDKTGEKIPPTGPFMNFRSIHTGLTVTKDEKWIATNWFRLRQT